MSESKKTPKPIEDVAKPGKSAPSPNSRAVIITHRDIMKDPMVVDTVKDEDEEKSSGATVEKTSDAKPSAPTVPKGERVVIPLSEKADTKDSTSDESKDTDEAAEKPLTDIADDEPSTQDTPTDTDDETLAEEPAAVEPEVEKSDLSDKSLAMEPPATSTAEEPQKDEPSTDQDAAADKDAAPTDAQIEAAAMAETAHDASVQKLIDSKKYYLPVNTVEKRRTQRFVVLGIILSILLVVAWADIALDAGIIQISGVKPVTHFFSN